MKITHFFTNFLKREEKKFEKLEEDLEKKEKISNELKKYYKTYKLKVKNVMQKPVLVRPNTTKYNLLKIAKKHPNTKFFVVAKNNKKFLGGIHEDNLFYMFMPNPIYNAFGIKLGFELERKFFAKTAKDLMRTQSYHCYDYENIFDVAIRFVPIEVNEMPVLNKKKEVVGIITQGILLRHIKLEKK